MNMSAITLLQVQAELDLNIIELFLWMQSKIENQPGLR